MAKKKMLSNFKILVATRTLHGQDVVVVDMTTSLLYYLYFICHIDYTDYCAACKIQVYCMILIRK